MASKVDRIVAGMQSCTIAELEEIHRRLEPWYFQQSRERAGAEVPMAFSFVGSFTRMIANTLRKALPA